MINKIKKYISSFLVDTQYISPESKDLKGVVVVITGASHGIGKAISEVLYREGASLALLSRNISKNDAIKTDEVRFVAIDTDVTDSASVRNTVNKILKKFGKIDVLINNAGQFSDKGITDLSETDYDNVMNTNVKGVFLMSQEVLKSMKQAKDGLIINIGSKISHNTNVSPNKVLYATSKYAVEGFSFALNKELKPLGIRVTCLMPGTVNTFVSTKSKQYLSPYDIGAMVLIIIKNKNIDFESILFKSVKQNL